MRTVTLKNGDKVPAIGLGTWMLGDSADSYESEREALFAGIEAGCTLIDTAEMYGEGRSETLVGSVVAQSDRSQLYLVSKVLPSNAGRPHLRDRFYRSLERLHTDYLDLYLLHWYGSVPLSETVEEMEKLVAEGTLKAWGVSNLDRTQMEELWALPQGNNCLVNQVLYHVASRGIEYDLVPAMREHHVTTMAYCPLAQGATLRQGKGLFDDPLLRALGKKYDAAPSEVALAYIIRDGHTIAIPRSGKAVHTLSNAHGGRLELSDDDYARITERFPAPNHPTPLDIQ
ncbi:MAG: aldo/keto reductase [Actinomycetaceae bacterium]|nr:aldo/keto reductase [Actinomycetaceae bacterium]